MTQPQKLRVGLIGPLYIQIRDLVKNRISAQEWRPGQALPSENDLAEEYGVAIGTIRKALQQLESENLLIRQRGRGTFVNVQGLRNDEERGKTLWANGRRIEFEFVQCRASVRMATEQEQRALTIEPDDQVSFLERIGTSESGSRIKEQISVPAEIYTWSNEPQSYKDCHLLHAFYRESADIEVNKINEEISITSSDAETSKALEVPKGEPVLHVHRLSVDASNRPIEWSVQWIYLNSATYRPVCS